MGLPDGTTQARLERLEKLTEALLLAMWGLHADSQHRSTGVLSPENITLLRDAADAAGVELPA